MNTRKTTIEPLPNGEFQVSGGSHVLGPFRLRETAEAAERMLNTFDAVESTIEQTLNTMRGESK